MRYSLKEAFLFGIIIAIAVLLIRAFGGGLPLSQLAALLVSAVVLATVQFMLAMRRARSHGKDVPPSRPERPRSARRNRPQDPFAHETNQAWTGLNATPVQEHEQREFADVPTEEPSSEALQRTPESSSADASTVDRRPF